eukprot:268032-Chlamydomonas_euryale.AAC.1
MDGWMDGWEYTCVGHAGACVGGMQARVPGTCRRMRICGGHTGACVGGMKAHVRWHAGAYVEGIQARVWGA